VSGKIVDKGPHNKDKKIETGNMYTCYCSVCGRYRGQETNPNKINPPDTTGNENKGNPQTGGGGTYKREKYATGGLNTKTGPAWLDGTPSKPELVLNARDTQNFIELKDVLADVHKNGGFSLAGGDNYYNIQITVD